MSAAHVVGYDEVGAARAALAGTVLAAVERGEAAALAMGTVPASTDKWHTYRDALDALVTLARESDDAANIAIRTLLLDVAAARMLIRKVTGG